MQKNKTIHITFIGRLEKEKGIEIVIDAIKIGMKEKRDIIWHICGDGLYLNKIQELQNKNIHVYGHISRDKIKAVLDNTDLVIMPSLFLETFGLVALETLSYGVPVCGFSQGGLNDFIHPSLTMDIDDPVNSFFSILDSGEFPLIDISRFSHENWISKLDELTHGVNRILLVNDYIGLVGGAEQYMHSLVLSLHSLGKTVEIYGFSHKTSRFMRIFLMILSPFAFWRGINLSRKIYEFKPDLIWMHSILRYIGPHGVRVISNYNCKKYITHHDLGLITSRPSQIYNEGDIPNSHNLGDWIPRKISIISIFTILIKWLYIQLIWNSLQKNTILHILPSRWMHAHFQKYYKISSIVYPHTYGIPTSFRREN